MIAPARTRRTNQTAIAVDEHYPRGSRCNEVSSPELILPRQVPCIDFLDSSHQCARPACKTSRRGPVPVSKFHVDRNVSRYEANETLFPGWRYVHPPLGQMGLLTHLPPSGLDTKGCAHRVAASSLPRDRRGLLWIPFLGAS